MRKVLFLVALAVALSVGASAASAGEPNLKALGLGSMSTVSQASAKQIRGQGAVVWGSSVAGAVGRRSVAGSTNGYFASGKTVAAGANLSVARAGSSNAYAGGFSAAFGK